MRSDRVNAGPVAVFGAAGHTGRFVLAELARRGISARAVVRPGLAASAPEAADLREADLTDPASVARAISGAGAVINCAGPFLDTAAAIASAALEGGAHYLDVTAEQPSAAATLAEFDAPAREAGLAVVPAMGFYGGLADLLVTRAMHGWNRADSVRIAIALDSWHPTRGTRLTGQRNTAQRLIISGGGLAPLSPPASPEAWTFPAPFGQQAVVAVPFSEIILIAHHLQADNVRTVLSEAALRDIRDPSVPPPQAADASGRSSQIFAVDVVAEKDGDARRLIASGRDIYAITAPLVCEAAERLLDGRFRKPGAHAPGAIFDAADFLKVLASAGLTITAA
ncbi:MAG: saccharopine dehydrogenase family protein [Hyphomonas sp.]